MSMCVVAACLVSGTSVRAEGDRTFAIQNVGSGKNLRPFEAGRHDGNRVVLYDHHWWRCLTWSFTRVGEDRFRLTNFYTGHTLAAASSLAVEIPLVQRESPSEDTLWELVAQLGGAYAIRLAGTELYITASSPETNSAITLSPFTDDDSHKWRLVPQRPWF